MAIQQSLHRSAICLLFLVSGLLNAAEPPDSRATFLAAHPVWRVAGDPDWRPYCFRAPDGSIVGLDVEFSRVLAERIGVRIVWVDVASWSDALERFRSGEIDLLMSVADSPERNRKMLFTRSYAASPVAVITRIESPFLVTLAELNGKTVATPAKHITTEYLQRTQPGITRLEVPGVSQACQAVEDGRADAMVAGLVASATAIKRLGLDNLKVAGLVDMRFDLCIAVRPDWPLARDLLDQAIAVDPPEVRIERFDRWIGPVLGLQQQVWRWRGWFRAALAGAGLLIAAVLGIALWNRLLRLRVERATAALRIENAARLESELRFRTIFEHAPIGMFRSTPDGRFLSVNPYMARLFAYADPARMIAEVNRVGIAQALFEDPDQRNDILGQVTAVPGSMLTSDVRYRTADGRIIDTLLSLCAIDDPVTRECTLVGFVVDVTDRKRIQASSQQRQNLLLLGQLASGIAHDFNNMLCGILGYAEVLKMRHADQPEVARAAQWIMDAVGSAQETTGQLLRFARRGTLEMAVFDLHECIRNAIKLFRSSRFSGDLVLALEATSCHVRGSAAALQNAVLNLCLNARDAMSAGGTLTITTTVEEIDAARAAALAPYTVEPGSYIHLRIADTGNGMSSAVLTACKEPFFSTKGEAGTGLGLTMVHGTLIEHRGAMRIDSTPGAGTTINLYVRLAEDSPAPTANRLVSAASG